MGDHTEVVQVTYDPSKISYDKLLDICFAEHSYRSKPYSIQYRSGIWYQNEEQKKAIAKKVEALKKKGPVYTHIAPLGEFYRAEEYHQKYFEKAGRA